jgi:regulatory protein
MLTVTKLESQKNNPDRLNVYLDGEFAFGISRAVAPWLEEGKQLSQEQIKSLQSEDNIELAYHRALNFLSYRIRSEFEIRQKLLRAEISEDIIQAVLEKLRSNSLVDDHEFARQWVENRIQFHPRGKRALYSELTQKGISSLIIEETLQDLNEEKLALDLAQKKISKLKNLQKSAFQTKLYGYLSRRGFDYSVSREVINSIWNDLEKNP